MRSVAGIAALLAVLSGCKGAPSAVDAYTQAVLKAPVASTGSGIDPDLKDNPAAVGAETKSPDAPSKIITTNGMQVREIVVDPRDAKARIDLLRTLLGADWLLAGRTVQDDGVVTYRFIRRDIFRVESDPFGLPDLTGAPKDMAGSKPK
ncbi:MAG TPA: hypothetical protein VK661_05565 [Planctomycetota bacterium]|nr:hypothetical protein [Planctomycetota bacterium]